MFRPGFTLIEMTVVIAIIVIMSVMVYANYEGISERGDILNSVNKFKDNVRSAQLYAMSSKSNYNWTPLGWGVFMDRTTNNYVQFSDFNGNGIYDYPVKLLIHGTEWSSGDTFSDSSASSTKTVTRNPAGSGPTETSSPGKPTGDGYWDFNGTTQYLSVPDHNDFHFGTDNFTMDTWIYSTSGGSDDSILSVGDGGGVNRSFRLYRDTDNYIKFYFQDSGGTAWSLAATSSAISINTWYHVAVTRSRQYIRLFVDGVQNPYTGVAQDMFATTSMRLYNQPLIIGRSDNAANYWHGRLDEIRLVKGQAIWNSEFSVPTIISPNDPELFRSFKLQPGIVFQRLVLAYPVTTVATNTLNIAWLRDYPTSELLIDGYSLATGTVVINHAGSQDSGTAADTPMTLTTSPYGGLELSNN